MSDYRRWDGAPPASGSYQPPRYESGPNYRDRPDFEGDRRRNESRDRDVPRYRNDPPVAAPSASRHAVRVDFDDFDRGSYRSPSPLRRDPQKTSSSSPRWRRSRSPGPVHPRDPVYPDKWAPRGASPPRDPARRDRSPPRDPVRRDRTPPIDRTGAMPWDAYGAGPSSRAPQQLQQAGGRLSPIPVSSKRPRSPTPGQDTRYVRRDYPATGEPSRYPPVGYSDRGPPQGLNREPERLREPPELGRRPPSPVPRRPMSPPLRDRYNPNSPPRRQPSPSSPSVIKTTTATIKEYVNSFSGILELSQDPSDRSIPPTVFFHASATWIVNRAGNPYGCPIKYLEVLGSNVTPSDDGVSLEREMPIGSKISVTAKQVDSPFVNYVALQIWPLTTEPPPKDELISGLVEKKQEHYLREFRNYLLDAKAAHGLVQATFPIFPWMGSGPDSAATVWQIKDENYGVLEVKGTIPEKFRFFALFHRDHVWLKDGKRGIDVEFFKGKPLSDMVRMGQPVTLSARSIVTTSGADLKPSILELQAIIVSLNVGHIPSSAPRPTMCLGGTGAYGMGSKASWYYYQQDLNNSLNRLLVTYLRRYDKNYPDLHPACQTFVEPKRKIEATGPLTQPGTSGSGGKFPNTLTNAVAKVCEHPSSEFFIVENYEHTWRCLVPASRTLSSGGRRSDMELIFPMASTVHFNAVLMEERNPVQYLATLAWSIRDIQPSAADLTSQNGQPDRVNLDLYWKYKPQPSHEDPTKPPAIVSAIKSSSIYFDGKEAAVLKLLDDNFGVLEVDGKLVLFDTCDIWLDPSTTADKIGKKLIDVISVGTVVYFHGALIDDSASIQYLASSVWLKKDAHLFTHKRPMPILKENIHKEKIDIYRLVVKSVGHTLGGPSEKASTSSQSQAVKEKWDKDIIYSYNGVIKCIFYDSSYSEHQHILGGVIEATENRSLAFFLTKHSLIYSILPSIGAKVKMNLKPIRTKSRWTEQVPFVAISLFQHGDVMENPKEVEKKFDLAKQKMVELIDHPLALAALETLKKGAVAGLIDVTPQGMRSALSSVGLKIHDEVPYSTLKCMISETSGVLENNFDKKSLCYFEVDDLNVESPIDLKDLVKIMTNTEGIRVRYQAKMISDRGSIQYVAHIGGVQIVGQLPPSMAHIKLKDEDFQSDTPVGLRSEKLNRYREAEEKYRRGKVISVASILDGSHKLKPDHVCARGVVRHVLNENFGLVYGPSDADEADKSYCLFDTFDLYLSVDMTAADAGKSVDSVTPAGTEIIYNACFINGDKAVPYLATSLWAADNKKVNPPLPSLPKESIQEDKLNIFVQVADSCAAVINELNAVSQRMEARRSQSRSKESEHHRGHSESRRSDSRRSDSRREDIEKVYSAESYKTYIRLLPKHRRGTRDPKTPDRNSSMSSAEWNEKISNFRADVYRWTKKKMELNSSGIKDVIVKNDLVDTLVTGKLLEEVNSKFAILQLSNGSKALLGHSRVWLNDKQLFGDWRALRTTFFCKLNVNARKWKGPRGIEYQVTFCHAGMHKVDFKTKNFLYTGAMKTWSNAHLNIQQLDAEAADFEAIVGKK